MHNHVVNPMTYIPVHIVDTNDFQIDSWMANISNVTTKVHIDIIDDDVNEADKQIFVVMLELTSALRLELITIHAERMFALIFIKDNDRKSLKLSHAPCCMIITDMEIGLDIPGNVFEVQEPPDGETAFFNTTLIAKSTRSEQTFFVNLITGLDFCHLYSEGLVPGSVTTHGIPVVNATQHDDYDFVTPTHAVAFPPELQTLPVTIVVYGDVHYDGPECFDLSVTRAFGPEFLPASLPPQFPYHKPYLRNRQLVTIDDNNSMFVIIIMKKLTPLTQ